MLCLLKCLRELTIAEGNGLENGYHFLLDKLFYNAFKDSYDKISPIVVCINRLYSIILNLTTQ